MRTAIFLGLIWVGSAIFDLAGTPAPPDDLTRVLGIFILAMIIMDLLEFLNNLTSR